MTRKNRETPRWERPSAAADAMPTLLFVDYEVPRYDLYAGSRTNFMYLEMLVEMGLEVKFLPADFQRAEPYSSELNQLGIETLDGEWFQQNWENWLKDCGHVIDYVFFHKPDPAAKFLPAIRNYTNAAIIYQCHDLHYLRLQRKAEVENDSKVLEEANIYEKKEDFIFTNSDVLLTFSEIEEKFISGKFPDKQVFTVPLFFYRDVPAFERDFDKCQDLLFVGSCDHSPNRDAISWFCSEVLPLIKRQIPGVVFNVVGANPPKEISSLQSKSIRILGSVSEKELNKLYANARLMVVPLRFGAGVKGKVIEALYKGLPLVSTAVGLEGIKGIDQLVSPQDSPSEFSAEVISGYENADKLEELSRAGLKFVADNFTLKKTAETMTNVLRVAKDEAAKHLEDTSGHASPRLIAFYLPQYHPIPENDEWWGEGFTEWRNVSKAEPLFSGHYQPHIPADLGYYDLRHEKTRIAQAHLAEKYGIEGFCYYHYWFNGHRLLERPLEEMLESGKPDFPFCLCWANESWTRRWDGKDKKILMEQEYSEADDRAHIQALMPVFRDKRYIRVNGKPLFLVYRAENIPDPTRTAEIWREEARKAGVGDLYLCLVESFTKCDPQECNFDAATEFAPDWWNKGPQLKADAEQFDLAGDSLGDICNKNWIHSYQALADTMMHKNVPAYKWFRCVTPSWDNWARMQNGCSIFLGSTPDKYQNWLRRAIDNTASRLVGDERIVFINAWNEWAEGNHLEPDQRYGHGYLEATKRALEDSRLVADSRRAGVSEAIRMGEHMDQLLNQDPHAAVHKIQLDERQQQVARRQQKIEEMLNSTSWRVTVPIRRAKQLLLDFKKLFSSQ